MKNNKGFTLVELIVVITILAILWTIAFISLQWYSSESRDSKRISDLWQIRTWLQIEQAREWRVPMPEESVTVTNSWSNLTIQWYAGTWTLNTLRISDNAKDPSDNKYYTYTTNANRTKFQLVTMLENTQTASNNNILITTTYADYTNRNAYPIGEPLWTLLDSTTKAPIQETSSWSIELKNNTTEYIPVFKRWENTTSSWSELVIQIIANSKWKDSKWSDFEPDCKVEDITIWNQTWAWCNSTLWDWVEWWKKDDWTNWIIWSCFNYDWNDNPSDPDCSIWNPDMVSNASAKLFFDKKQPDWENNNWDSEFDTIWWKLYTHENAIKETNWACPSWWHVPTDEEWTILTTNLNWWDYEAWTGWLYSWLGWNWHSSITENINLANALKLPLLGHHNYNESFFKDRGRSTYLWSSTLNVSGNAFSWHLHRYYDGVLRSINNLDHAFSVRCLKD